MKTSRRKFLQKSALTALGVTTVIDTFSLIPSQTVKKVYNGQQSRFPISIFSKHLQWLEYQEMAEFAASAGFDGVDLTVRPGGHVLPERVKEDLPNAVNAIQKAGLEVYMITTAITDPDDPYTEDILKAAGKLKIPYYRLGWFDFEESKSLEKNLEAFKVRFKKLAALGKKHSICGDYQNHSGTSLGGSIWDLWFTIKDEDPTWVGCQFDIRHATVEGAYSWPVGLRLIGPYIHTMDFKDYLWKKDEGKWIVENVPLGEGMVDYDGYFNQIKEKNIAGPISLHYEYSLGGAEHGHSKTSMSKEEIMKIFKKDLLKLKGWLYEFGLV